MGSGSKVSQEGPSLRAAVGSDKCHTFISIHVRLCGTLMRSAYKWEVVEVYQILNQLTFLLIFTLSSLMFLSNAVVYIRIHWLTLTFVVTYFFNVGLLPHWTSDKLLS